MKGASDAPMPPREHEDDVGPIVQRQVPVAAPPFAIPPLFGKYSFEGVEVRDPGLLPYLYLHAVYAPHTEGRLCGRPFMKVRMHLVERLANHLMKGGKFTGKKMKALSTVRQAFDEIAEKEGKNPIQILVDAVENAAPREEVTRLQFGGISVPRAVDASPSRRLNVAVRNLALGAIQASRKSTKPIQSCLADEIRLTAKGEMTAFSIGRKEETERVSQSAR